MVIWIVVSVAIGRIVVIEGTVPPIAVIAIGRVVIAIRGIPKAQPDVEGRAIGPWIVERICPIRVVPIIIVVIAGEVVAIAARAILIVLIIIILVVVAGDHNAVSILLNLLVIRITILVPIPVSDGKLRVAPRQADDHKSGHDQVDGPSCVPGSLAGRFGR